MYLKGTTLWTKYYLIQRVFAPYHWVSHLKGVRAEVCLAQEVFDAFLGGAGALR